MLNHFSSCSSHTCLHLSNFKMRCCVGSGLWKASLLTSIFHLLQSSLSFIRKVFVVRSRNDEFSPKQIINARTSLKPELMCQTALSAGENLILSTFTLVHMNDAWPRYKQDKSRNQRINSWVDQFNRGEFATIRRNKWPSQPCNLCANSYVETNLFLSMIDIIGLFVMDSPHLSPQLSLWWSVELRV